MSEFLGENVVIDSFRHFPKVKDDEHRVLDYCVCDIPKYSFLGHFPLGNLPCAAYHQRMAGTAAE